MVYVKWFFRIVAFVLVFGTLSYVLLVERCGVVGVVGVRGV